MIEHHINPIFDKDTPRTFHDLLSELEQPLPWYENLFNAIVYRFPYRIECAYDNLRDSIERGRRGYARSDTWNLYVYLAEIISKTTRDLANETHGYPPEFENSEDWVVVLRMISAGFGKVVEIEERFDYSSPTEEEQAQIDEAFDLMKRYFMYMWD